MSRKKKTTLVVHQNSEMMNAVDNLCQKATNCVNGVCCYLNECFTCPPQEVVTRKEFAAELWVLGRDQQGGE